MAAALLTAFKVPKDKWNAYLSWARFEAKRDSVDTYAKTSLGVGLGPTSAVESKFKKIKRTT